MRGENRIEFQTHRLAKSRSPTNGSREFTAATQKKMPPFIQIRLGNVRRHKRLRQRNIFALAPSLYTVVSSRTRVIRGSQKLCAKDGEVISRSFPKQPHLLTNHIFSSLESKAWGTERRVHLREGRRVLPQPRFPLGLSSEHSAATNAVSARIWQLIPPLPLVLGDPA
ncbi:hypothetical protein JMJ77_0007842 [Colletotrichum scovillei]|uniref:Uncharacterized protein n=1 Tax=Colletotrichum scovillei TaxID=1209932 RepID=A0A9P7RD08_9PEZI|nr:hypothetical protein JMJ77_0007842 [Colletotrichum scovillei]KAG7074852.1 hypothetical protein JMJ76_0011320 [Colletotrichum scovillei]